MKPPKRSVLSNSTAEVVIENIGIDTLPYEKGPKAGDFVTIKPELITNFPNSFLNSRVYKTTSTGYNDMVELITEAGNFPISIWNLNKASEVDMMNSLLEQYGES